MEGWQVVVVILAAVLVGALLPVLFQVYATLRAIRTNVERLGPRVENTLGEVHEVTERVNRTTAGIEEGVDQMRAVVSKAGEVTKSFHKIRRSLRTGAAVGGAVGPAIVAAVRALSDKEGATNGRPAEAKASKKRRKKKGRKKDRGERDAPEAPGAGAAGADSSMDEQAKGETA